MKHFYQKGIAIVLSGLHSDGNDRRSDSPRSDKHIKRDRGDCQKAE